METIPDDIPDSSETSGEDPAGEIAATHPPNASEGVDIPDSSETSGADPAGEIAESFPGSGTDPQTEPPAEPEPAPEQ
jgi:hypothetical protein